MCRLLAYKGPPTALETLIVTPKHSLLEQSQHANEAKISVQGDGFGIAWYDQGRGPGLYRDILPAWSDGNLPSLCRMIRSDLFLAHVRASTTGETSRLNCHPFQNGRWTFMHNGQIPDFAMHRRTLEALLPDALYVSRRGTTDSELVFLLLLHFGLDRDPKNAITATLHLLRETCAWGTGPDACRLTCVLSNGDQIFAFRVSSDAKAPTLYRQNSDPDTLVLASEALDGCAATWTAIDENILLCTEGDKTKLSALNILEPA